MKISPTQLIEHANFKNKQSHDKLKSLLYNIIQTEPWPDKTSFNYWINEAKNYLGQKDLHQWDNGTVELKSE